MATLTGQSIDSTYSGLLKLEDNGTLDALGKIITDGEGNQSPITIGTGLISISSATVNYGNSTINFPTGNTVDFTGATVTGLPSAAGLVSGTGSDSMKNADALNPTYTASASGIRSIAIGGGSLAPSTGSAMFGNFAIGYGSGNNGMTAINGSSIFGANGFGALYNASFARAVQIGWYGFADTEGVSIGAYSKGEVNSVGIGHQAKNTASGDGQVAIGYFARTQNAGGVAIGHGAQSQAASAVAIGKDTIAANANYVAVPYLEITNYSSLNYADDAAAATGGVPLGGVYHTSGALKIRTV